MAFICEQFVEVLEGDELSTQARRRLAQRRLPDTIPAGQKKNTSVTAICGTSSRYGSKAPRKMTFFLIGRSARHAISRGLRVRSAQLVGARRRVAALLGDHAAWKALHLFFMMVRISTSHRADAAAVLSRLAAAAQQLFDRHIGARVLAVEAAVAYDGVEARRTGTQPVSMCRCASTQAG